MKEYRIGFNMYNMIKEEKDESDGPWKNFLKYVMDENVEVIVVLAGKDHLKILYDPDSNDKIKEVVIA